MSKNFILADGRWSGPHGIGRFSDEVLSRLHHADILKQGPKPLSVKNFAWLSYQLHKNKDNYKVFYTPGFNPILYSSMPYVMTICDLIHLHIPGKAALAKKIYYEKFIKPAVKRAFKIVTISDYSKKTILDWADIPEENVINVGCGISDRLNHQGTPFQPGYNYLFYVGNTKPHKNLSRLLESFAIAKIDLATRLILTGNPTPALQEVIKKNKLETRVMWSGILSEIQLAEYYRGATSVLFPSLYEGFGLPILEAWACGTTALTSNVTSLPEVAADAAVIVDPYEVDSIANGIEKITNDKILRNTLIQKGFERVKLFSWDKTTQMIQTILNSAALAR